MAKVFFLLELLPYCQGSCNSLRSKCRAILNHRLKLMSHGSLDKGDIISFQPQRLWNVTPTASTSAQPLRLHSCKRLDLTKL